MPFYFTKLEIPDVIKITSEVLKDDRGFFMETYKYSEFLEHGITEHFVQDNVSKSKKNVLRGLHYQKNPKAQGKLIRCLKGRIFDVAVDIRKQSPTYGKWIGLEMSGEDTAMLYIPVGFAHGFVVLGEEAVVNYKCTQEYSSEHDKGILWNDPQINITWPIKDPILSMKDLKHPLLKDADNNFG